MAFKVQFRAGVSTFAITATQGPNTDTYDSNPSTGNGNWGEPTGGGVTATINLVKRSNLQVAPEGFFLSVSLTGFDSVAPASDEDYDPTHHDLYYRWDLGDPGATWDAPVNVLAHQRDANVAYGPQVAHVYDTHGNKTVSVLVIEPSSGKVAEATFKIGGTGADTPTIQDPDVVFPTAQTIIVDNTNTGLPAYPSAVVRTSLNDALVYARGFSTTPHRIIVRDGQEFTSGTTGLIATNASTHIVREGGGVKPKITWTSGARLFQMINFDANNEKDAVINGIHFEGGWDSTTETGNNNHSCIEQTTDQGDYLLIHNTEIRNFGGHAYVALQFTNETGVRIFSNVISVGHRSYHFYEEINAPVAYLGVRAMSDVNALSGGPRNGNHNDASVIRFQSAKNVIMDGCDVFCRTGWVENYFGHYTEQQAIRLDQRGNSGTRTNIQRCTIESAISLKRANAATNSVNPQNNLFERNFIVASAFTQDIVQSDHGGLTMRNNFLYIPDSPLIDYYGLFNTVRLAKLTHQNDSGAQTGNMAASKAAPIKFENNTIVSLQSISEVEGVFYNDPAIDGGFDNVTETNNLIHAPNEAAPQVDFAPLATSAAITPRHNGYKSKYERVEFTLASSVAAGATVTVAYPSGRSAADYDATAQEAHRIGFGWKNGASRQDCTVVFGGSDMTVTNDSGAEWAAGEAVLILFCPTSPSALPQYATNTPISLHTPDAGSSANAGATGTKVVGDWYGAFRPAVQSVGAFEAV